MKNLAAPAAEAGSATPIAVIGLACYYPGAKTPLELWENVLARRQQFRDMPDVRLPKADYFDADPLAPDKTYLNKAAVIDGYEYDWLKMRTPRKAYDSTDIAHWLTLDTALQAIADAGYTIDKLPRDTSGVVLGNTLTGEFFRAETMRLRWPYVRRALRASAEKTGLNEPDLAQLEDVMETYYKSVFAPVTEDTLPGNLANTIAGRVCNYMDIHGGGYIVDGACASSLLAIKTAATYLADGEMDLVIAGGVDISLDTFEVIGFAKIGALTRADMNVYDKKGKGFIPGEGCGMVVLKRLADAQRDGDTVYAVMNGWGVSSDGKGGLTAPKSETQAMALTRAYEKAGLDPHTLDFIEGHGTGTSVGDKVELEGISLALNKGGKAPARSCGVTSFKSIVGHTKAAAGVGAFIKTAIALNRRVIPPTAGCAEPHAIFDDAASCLYPVLQGAIRNPSDTLQAGVSAMGFGGINCHVQLESAGEPSPKFQPQIEERKLLVASQQTELFLYSANSLESLRMQLKAAIKNVEGMSLAELRDYAFSINTSINHDHAFKASIVAEHPEDLLEKLRALASAPVHHGQVSNFQHSAITVSCEAPVARVGALFSGQGSQQVNMARMLVERYDWARELLERAKQSFAEETDMDITEKVFKPFDQAADEHEIKAWQNALKQTDVAQPAIVLASLLWYKFLSLLNIKFSVTAGHSLGELPAFYLAGAYDEATVLKMAALRGKAMAAGGSGTMASLACSLHDAETIIHDAVGYVTIANINSPQQIVISGETKAIEHAISLAESKGIKSTKLPVSAAFHSALVGASAGALKQFAPLNKSFHPAEMKLISTMTGKELKEDIQLAGYFSHQVVSRVDFVSAVKTMKEKCEVIVEIGPGRILCNLATAISHDVICLPVESKAGGDKDLNVLLGQLFVRGIKIDCVPLYEGRMVRRFVPASQKKFIVAPLERPFPAELENVNGLHTQERQLTGALSSYVDIPQSRLEEYLAQRGEFISEVIKADLKISGFSSQESAAPQRANRSAVEEVRENASPAKSPASARETVYRLISSKTGFPAGNLSDGLRLLDDLNLDSIMAGAIIADITSEFDIQTVLEPVEWANAQLGALISHIETLNPRRDGSAKQQAAGASSRAVLYSLISSKTGFPEATLSDELRLLNDLNMDSIKSGALIADLAAELGVGAEVTPVELANASLHELIYYFDQHLPDSAPVIVPVIKQQRPNTENEASRWTRSLTVNLEQAPWNDELIKDCINWRDSSVAIRYARGMETGAKSLSGHFLSKGTSCESLSLNNTSGATDAEHLICLLHDDDQQQESERLSDYVEQLASIASIAGKAGKTLTLVQAGEGKFSMNGAAGNAASPYSAVSFAASIQLEIPGLKVRVLDLSAAIAQEQLPTIVHRELETEDAFSAVGYDCDLSRWVMRYDVEHPKAQEERAVKITPDDVVLVTGGAKGITAACSLAMAEKWGCKMALVGSTPLTAESRGNSANEIRKTLESFAEKGLSARYYSCDVSFEAGLKAVIEQAQADLGKITVVVHGAALNKPRVAAEVSAEAAMQEIAPKLLGGLHLLNCFEGQGLKLFVGITSIIGVSGMIRNAWYAFSNESLDLHMRAFEKRNPGTETLTLAYSVWEEIGMGAKMGSPRFLKEKGVESIKTGLGIDAFMNWLQYRPADQQVVVSGRRNALAEWDVRDGKPVITAIGDGLVFFPRDCHKLPAAHRFIEKILFLEPDVESVTESLLTLEKDDYVNDHVYNGSYLFPTVFGIEAMAQNIAFLTGRTLKEDLLIRDLKLERPIVVQEERGTRIRIQTLVLEKASPLAPDVVEVAVYAEQSGFKQPHFSARFIIGEKIEPANEWQQPASVTDLQPKRDLYGNLLFQGEQFQQMQSVYALSPEQVTFRSGVADFSDHSESPYLLGDPFHRDTLLQSGQLLAPHLSCLPVFINNWYISNAPVAHQPYRNATARLGSMVDKTIYSTVASFNAAGECCEVIGDYQLRILKEVKNGPKPQDLIQPGKRDSGMIAARYREAAGIFALPQTGTAVDYGEAFEQNDKELRHEAELPVIHAAVSGLDSDNSPEVLEVSWDQHGKPLLHATAPAYISLSHVQHTCVAVSAGQAVGFDFETIDPATDFERLVGSKGRPAYAELCRDAEHRSLAGARLWSAMEAAIKLTGRPVSDIRVKAKRGEYVLFACASDDDQVDVLTFPLSLTLGSEKAFAYAFMSGEHTGTAAQASVTHESEWAAKSVRHADAVVG